jgi:hypothetical protein
MKKIPLTQGKFAIVDDEDYEWLMQWKWHARKVNGRFYACRRLSRRLGHAYVHMHQEILRPPPGYECDHINRDPLDNRRANLRKATRRQNMRNRGKCRTSASRFKCVIWDAERGKWASHIGVFLNGKRKLIHLGRFNTEEEAARAYDMAAIHYFGEFASLNFPRDTYNLELTREVS